MSKVAQWQKTAVKMFENAGDIIKDAIYEYQGIQVQQPDGSLKDEKDPDDSIKILYGEISDQDLRRYANKFNLTSQDIKSFVPSYYINGVVKKGDTVIKETSERLEVKGYALDPAEVLYILFLKEGF